MLRSMKKAHSDSNPQPAAPASADAEQAARMLDRLAEMAMERAEAMHAASLAAIKAGDAAAAKELEISLDRIARGIRRTLALKLHLARKRQDMAQKAAAQARDRAEEKTQRRRQVARAVSCSIGGDDSVGAEKGEALLADLWERLIEDEDIDAALALADHPLEEIVIHLCRDMGIHPDPAWLNPDYSGADWSYGRDAEGEEPEPEPESESRMWPETGPEAGRYFYFKGSRKTPPGWIDLFTEKRLDRPPWELKPGGR
ncbi:outer membrane PBP1 activator LpoA protein [Inquilinus ginsengisoli]